MRMPKFDSAPMAGFTLIEALVATALMGFILAALATITAQWLPNWNHGVVRVQRNEQVALGLERLAADLAAADFIPANNQTRKPFFDGASRSVTFVRTALGPDTGPGLEFVRIAEISSERGPVLVRTRAPFVPGIDRQPNFTDPVVLLRAPYRLSFSYAGTDRNWREDWREQVQLPNAVKLTVRDATTQRTLSVSTATLIHVEVPVDCIAAKSLAECLTSTLRPSADADKSRS
ncbi:MAG: prepilin-type N-terminal cleavage/methylation domain-containing protein [Pseudolabrys sp.]|jgi:general secretion pathway protein J